jgi:DNA-binding MarR family transcriptional regulator
MDASTDPTLELREWLPYQLVSTADTVSRAFAVIYRERYGLTRQQWRVLAAVAANPGMTSAEVCSYSTLDKMQVSRAVAQLSEAGLLGIRRGAGDRRTKRLQLSARGRQLYTRLVPLAQRLERELLAGLDPAEARLLRRLLPKLSARAAALGDAAAGDGD